MTDLLDGRVYCMAASCSEFYGANFATPRITLYGVLFDKEYVHPICGTSCMDLGGGDKKFFEKEK